MRCTERECNERSAFSPTFFEERFAGGEPDEQKGGGAELRL
ncbi:hypothetical protein SAMN05216388_100668 [Halorientalis persicus]|uniref:Uncharacterized protein n=1 Tax=Halorientalis persicus TaxID=1367881 RepID=A0A1H8KI15_9EURY|nr:hypothetical protein SAMN05216388_100668 [Halorientalis persicus]